MKPSEIRDRFERAYAIQGPLQRRLYLCALLSESLPPAEGIPLIVVGGHALEFYTLGDYTTADVDLVSHRRREIVTLLEGWGFERVGRYWYHSGLDVTFEILDESLAGSEERVTRLEIEGLTVHLIGVEDLVVDRLNAYVRWRSEDDGHWARELIALYRDEIDWAYLRVVCEQNGVSEALREIVAEEGMDEDSSV